MRKLQTRDLFNAMRLIEKAGIKEEIKPIIRRAQRKEADATEIGMEVIIKISQILIREESEKAFYDFLSGPLEMEAREVEEMNLEELVGNLKKVAEGDNLKFFFTTLQNLITSQQ